MFMKVCRRERVSDTSSAVCKAYVASLSCLLLSQGSLRYWGGGGGGGGEGAWCMYVVVRPL